MRRYIEPGRHAAVWHPSGRWGPSRVRVEECVGVLRAEDVYTGLLRDHAARMTPGGKLVRGSLGFRLPLPSGDASHTAEWEIRPNAVWRYGRVFLRCPRCTRAATRLYLPTAKAWLACRRCWGLSYTSRQHRNYKPGRDWWARIGLDPRMSAAIQALGVSERRAEAAEVRHAERREILGARTPDAPPRR